ncbi:hypothetical protein [Clostridium tyrobutyricum]|uniref:hypothetical protein n=1 Tax=Clostridium tyrobutyricum TaxID=1519 RepID=UPI00057F0F54|nr:hypothetical protein [Clostridium tyrobutyricum]
MEDLIKGELDWHNKVNENFHEIDSQMADITQRKFKPNLGTFADWAPSLGNAVDRTRIQSDIDSYVKAGIEEFVMCINFDWDSPSNSFVSFHNLDDMLWAIQQMKNVGIKTVVLKMHCHTPQSTIQAMDFTNFTTAYKNFVTMLAQKFQNQGIEYFIPLNEKSYIYTNSTYESFCQDLLNIGKTYGYTYCGFSTSGWEENEKILDNLKNAVDCFFLNCYPGISYKLDDTTLEDGLEAWENSELINYLKHFKATYPNKPIIMSETGVMDYWCALVAPGTYNWSTIAPQDYIKTYGKAPAIMLYGLFNSTIKYYINKVWWCYNDGLIYDPCIKLIKEYIGGVYNE